MATARAGASRPAKPQSFFFLALATVTAVIREASNFSIRIPFRSQFIRLPTVGRTSLVLANVIVLLVLCFYGLDLGDRWSREDIGYRTGFVTIGQIPLIFLLAGKNNIVGYLTGVSHERLNWLHRWCARTILLTATIHMGYFFSDWAPYDYIGTQLKENTLVWKGMAAWAILVWIVFSSMTPIRGWSYEFFVLQHLVSFAGFIAFVYIHTPAEVHGCIWAPVALFFLDRVVRVLRVLYANLALFHPRQRKAGQMSGLWACKAEFIPLPHNTTRMVIHNPPISWTPGQHVFLSCHSILPLQSHPFTIASIPADGKMEFLVKAEGGGTKRFFSHAEKTHGLPAISGRAHTSAVAIEGPYGTLRPLRQFDSVVLFAGSTGATFIVPLLRDILQGWIENTESTKKTSFFSQQTGAVTRHVRFVWVVKSRGQLGWFSEQLSAVSSDFKDLQDELKDIKLEMTVYVTCDESFTEEHKTLLSSITAPNIWSSSKEPREPKVYARTARNGVPSLNEKEKMVRSEDIKEVSSSASLDPAESTQVCGPDGTCCCKTTVNESDGADTIAPCSCCTPEKTAISTARSLSHTSSSPSMNSAKKLFVHSSISVLSGRPNPRSIIRKSLEQARGESAVIVCGPQGLVADVKQDVCLLSDERAVHKGTGAQGIYLHTESFGY
jgi:NAD(P)H-flavin reductase